MKIFLSLLILMFASVALFIYTSKTNATNSNSTDIISPVLEQLVNYSENVLGVGDIWEPTQNQPKKDIPHPTISAVGAISYDVSEDYLLYTKNDSLKLPIASLTKIMTAIIALENGSLADTYTVSKSAASVGENTMGISEGEIFTMEELLYGMMLPSGNDASEVLAEGSKFGKDTFVFLMNKKAEDLGMINTRFTNSSGLEGDGFQYSTAVDLLILTRYAMQNEGFAKIVSTYEYEIPETESHKYYHLINETNLLTSYPGVRGVKTGFTWEAGLCLVTYLKHDGHEIIAVLLNSQNRRDEMKRLLDYSLIRLGQKPPQHS